MRVAAYNALRGAPAKIAFGVELFLSLAPTLWPKQIKEWAGWALTPEQIRLLGLLGLVIGLSYFLVLTLLKPPPKPELGNTAKSSGPKSPPLSGNEFTNSQVHIGDVYNAPPPPQVDPHAGRAPGLGLHVALKLLPDDEKIERHLIGCHNENGAEVRLGLTPNNRLRMFVTDAAANSYDVEATTGRKGVTIDHWLYLSAEVGCHPRETILEIRVNGEIVAARTLPFAVKLGDSEWSGMSIGPLISDAWKHGELTMANFEVGELKIFDGVLGAEDRQKVKAYLIAKWGIEE